MNAAVVELASTVPSEPAVCDCGLGGTGHQCEWIDPEGDDWLSSIYRELTGESTPSGVRRPVLEFEHWFG
jgi:hypothetical protein